MLKGRKRFILIIVSMCFLMICIFLQHRKTYIVISGDVIYSEFKKGLIDIYWREKLEVGKPKVRDSITLPAPGRYKLRVPANAGDVYICARNRGTIFESFAYFISEPIDIGARDIYGYNIKLKTKRMLMDNYHGKTIKISGNVFYDNYKKGKIDICAYTPDYYKKICLPPDIAVTSVNKPGEFTLYVPANTGIVCLLAINIPPGVRSGNSPQAIRGGYDGNPLVIKDSDITGIDLTIDQKKYYESIEK